MSTSIKTLLCVAMKDALQETCIDDVPEGDDTRVGLVVVGRHTGSITRYKIVIEVHPQHLLGPERDQGRDTQAHIQPDGYEWELPPETIGGSRLRWYRGTIQIRHYLKMDREEALAIIQVVAERIANTLETEDSLIGLVDDFGNRIHALEVADTYAYTNEAGDPATERTFMNWRALVSRKRSRA